MERLALIVILIIPTISFGTQFHIGGVGTTFALNEFGRQSNLQILFDYNVVEERRLNDIDGELEPDEALRLMLEGSGLTFDFVNERTLAVTVGVIKPKIVDSVTLAKWMDAFEYTAMSYSYDSNTK